MIIEGDCELGDFVEIGAGCILKNTKIAAGTKVQAYSVFDGAVVGENAQLDHLHAYAQALNWQMKYISATLLKLKIQRLDWVVKLTISPI